MLHRTDPEITAFLEAFESCTLPKAEWTQAAHLLTGACYVHALGAEAAIAAMRVNVRRYNVSVGCQNTSSSGYYETITIAWIKLLAAFRIGHPYLDCPTFAHLAVAHFVLQCNIFAAYYDFDLLASAEGPPHPDRANPAPSPTGLK